MSTVFRTMQNMPGYAYDEEDAERVYAEDWVQVTEAINALETLLAGGVSGTFTTVDLKTVTVTNGIITGII